MEQFYESDSTPGNEIRSKTTESFESDRSGHCCCARTCSRRTLRTSTIESELNDLVYFAAHTCSPVKKKGSPYTKTSDTEDGFRHSETFYTHFSLNLIWLKNIRGLMTTVSQ